MIKQLILWIMLSKTLKEAGMTTDLKKYKYTFENQS